MYSSAWQLISALLVFLLGIPITAAVAHRFGSSSGRSQAIYCWHTLFCVLYCWYVLTYGGDSLGYYWHAHNENLEPELGTMGVTYLTSILVQGMGLSFLGTFLVFNIFGTIGLLAFDRCLFLATRDKQRRIQQLANLIVFLPSVSFWSSAIGKDALSFMAIGLAMWAALNLGKRSLLMAFAVTVMLLVRPHIAGMMVLGLTLASLLDPRATLGKRLVLGAIAAGVAAAMIPFALQFAGVGENVDADTLMTYIESRQGQNMQGGGGVDIANMPLPVQLFTYMFRPVIFEASSLFALAAAIDNLILLYLFIAGGSALWKGQTSGLGENRVFMWSYSMLAWLILAMTTANLGIALRQKWMFAPMVIFLFISLLGQRQPVTPSHGGTIPVPVRSALLDRPKLRKS